MDERTNQELARSHNLTTLTKNATTHCEVNCIREITENVGGIEEAKEVFGNTCCYVSVEPCIMCAYALNLAGIKRVIFGC